MLYCCSTKYATFLYEASVATKARTRAKLYIPSTSDKYAVRFYALLQCRTLYIHSIWNNGYVYWCPGSEAKRCVEVFTELRTANGYLFNLSVNRSPVRSLRTIMLGLQTK